MALINPPKGRLFNGWLKKRMPPHKQQTLTQRSIFIFPSRFGLVYLFVCLFLYTLGTNYQNNLILLLAFTLVGFFITSILFSYANLSGLTLKSGQSDAVYVNDTVLVPIYLSHSLNRNLLIFTFAGHEEITLELAQEHDKVHVPFKPKQRGWTNPGRLTLKSYFPLGLLRCWTHLDLDIELLAYPEPIDNYVPLLSIDQTDDIPQSRQDDYDDFAGIKEHVKGESLSRISWKHVARNQQKLVSKQFTDGEIEPMWLTLEQCRGDNIEQRLSKLAFAVNDYARQNIKFGLDLGKVNIAPGSSDEHRQACLKALALW